MKVEVYDVEWGGPVNSPTIAGEYEVPEEVIASCKSDEERDDAAGNWLVDKLESETGFKAESFTWDVCK